MALNPHLGVLSTITGVLGVLGWEDLYLFLQGVDPNKIKIPVTTAGTAVLVGNLFHHFTSLPLAGCGNVGSEVAMETKHLRLFTPHRYTEASPDAAQIQWLREELMKVRRTTTPFLVAPWSRWETTRETPPFTWVHPGTVVPSRAVAPLGQIAEFAPLELWKGLKAEVVWAEG